MYHGGFPTRPKHARRVSAITLTDPSEPSPIENARSATVFSNQKKPAALERSRYKPRPAAPEPARSEESLLTYLLNMRAALLAKLKKNMRSQSYGGRSFRLNGRWPG